MSKTLSVFFNIDRTYLTLVDGKKEGMELLYLNTTESRIDLEFPDSDASVLGAQELEIMMSEFAADVDRLTVTLPAESVLVTKFPSKENISKDDLCKLVDFELRQNFPQFNYNEFTISATPLEPRLDGKLMMLGVIIPNNIFDTASKVLKPVGKNIDFIEISQLNAHSSFLYNYPETAKSNVALISVQSQFLDISLSKDGKPAYYSLQSFSSIDKIGEIIEKEFARILTENAQTIDTAYFFGSGLTKEILMICWETAMMLGIEAKRLNAFRMMKTGLSKREREYCSRTFHLYPACIGASIPPYHERIKLF